MARRSGYRSRITCRRRKDRNSICFSTRKNAWSCSNQRGEAYKAREIFTLPLFVYSSHLPLSNIHSISWLPSNYRTKRSQPLFSQVNKNERCRLFWAQKNITTFWKICRFQENSRYRSVNSMWNFCCIHGWRALGFWKSHPHSNFMSLWFFQSSELPEQHA